MSDFQDLITQRLEARIEAGAMSAASIRIQRGVHVLLNWAGGRLDFGPEEAGPTLQACSNIAAAALCGPR